MDVKGEVLLQLFNKSKLRNRTKTFLEPNILFIVKFKKLEFKCIFSTLYTTVEQIEIIALDLSSFLLLTVLHNFVFE